MDTIRPTRYPDLGYMEHGGVWRIVTTEDGAAVGPQYATKAELLADLDRYAAEYLGKPDPRDARIRELEGALRGAIDHMTTCGTALRVGALSNASAVVYLCGGQGAIGAAEEARRVLGGAS